MHPQQPITTLYQSTRLFAFEIAKALIDAGALTREQAAGAMLGTADQIRKATEGENDAHLGGAFAIGFEQVGGWLLGSDFQVT